MKKKVLIIGFGASGQACFELVSKQVFDISIWDDNSKFFHDCKIDFESVCHGFFDFAILSPGVHPQNRVVQTIKSRSIPIYGEAEYALKMLPNRKIAITGTNGKTTVTYLCEHILNFAGISAVACGNISKDRSFSSYVGKVNEKFVLVCEVSSFQLETLNEVRFDSSIILNITPDHLDRYENMHAYAQSKCHLQSLSATTYIHKSVKDEFPDLVYENSLIYALDKDPFLNLEFDNSVDEINAKSAFLLLSPFNIPEDVFKNAVTCFQKPPHRLEKIRSISGVDFVNDSKATNIDATTQALKAYQKPIILLAGGVDKGHPYSAWIPYLDNVKEIVCFGASQDLIFNELQHVIKCEKKHNLENAVLYAYDQAKNGDIVLLSPGCSSFDQFKDYQDRGDKFRQYVMNLVPREILI